MSRCERRMKEMEGKILVEKTLIHWLTGTNAVELYNQVDWSAGSSSHTSPTPVLYESMQEILQRIMGCGSTTFNIEQYEYGEWHCFPVIVSCCFDIPEGKEISLAKH